MPEATRYSAQVTPPVLPTSSNKPMIDVGGHYSRLDVLQLMINRRPIERVVEMNSDYQTMFPIGGDDPPCDPAKRNELVIEDFRFLTA